MYDDEILKIVIETDIENNITTITYLVDHDILESIESNPNLKHLLNLPGTGSSK